MSSMYGCQRDGSGNRVCRYWNLVALLIGALVSVGLSGEAVSLAQGQNANEKETRPGPGQVHAIRFDASESRQIVAVTLDRQIYLRTRVDFGDLRILNQDDQAVPHILIRQMDDQTTTDRETRTVVKKSVKPMEDNQLLIQWDLSVDLPWTQIDGIRLETVQKDFEHLVSVEFQSGASEPWKQVAKDVLIYDYSRFMDASSTDVAFDPPVLTKDGGALRLRVSNVVRQQPSSLLELTTTTKAGEVTEQQEKTTVRREALRISGLEMWHLKKVVHHKIKKVEYPLDIMEVQDQTEKQNTVVRLKSGREPLTGVRLVTQDVNFSRQGTLTKVDGPEEEVPVVLQQGTLTRIELGTVRQQKLSLSFHETRGERYELTVDNGDSAPLQDWKFIAEGPSYQVVFEAIPGASYRLAYGNAEATLPRFDTAALNAAWKAGTPAAEAELGAAQDYFWQKPSEDLEVPWWQSPWVYGPLVALLILVLGFALRHAAGQLEHVPD